MSDIKFELDPEDQAFELEPEDKFELDAEDSVAQEKSMWQSAQDHVGGAVAGGQDLLPGIGIVDKIGAASYATQQEVGDLFRDKENQRDWVDRYDGEVHASPKRREGAMEKSPVGSAVGKVAMLPVLAAMAPGAGVAGLTGAAARVAGSTGIVMGDQATRNPDKLIDTDRALDEGSTAAKWATAFEALPLVGKLAKPASKAYAKIMGRSDDVIDKYVKDQHRYNDPNVTFESTQDLVQAPLQKIDDSVGAARAAEVQAKDAHKIARQEYIQGLRDVTVPGDTPDEVAKILAAQRGRVGVGAAEQTRVLRDSGTTELDMEPLLETLKEGKDSRKIAGVLTPGDEEVAAINDIEQILSKVANRKLDAAQKGAAAAGAELTAEEIEALRVQGMKVAPEDLMKLRQRIGDQIQASFRMPDGSYTAKGDALGKSVNTQINKILDSQMANSATYQKVRAQLSKESALAERGSKTFGKDNKLPILSSLANSDNREKRALLEYLDKRNNGKVMERLNPYLDAQKKLGNKPALERAVLNLPTAGATKAAMATRTAAESTLAEVGNLRPNQAQDAIRKLLFASPIKPETGTRDAIAKLTEFTKKNDPSAADLNELVETLRVSTAFRGGGSPNGSRLVQWFSGIGRMIPMPGAEVTAATIGALLDHGKGASAKSALDAAIGIGKAAPRVRDATSFPAINLLLQDDDEDVK